MQYLPQLHLHLQRMQHGGRGGAPPPLLHGGEAGRPSEAEGCYAHVIVGEATNSLGHKFKLGALAVTWHAPVVGLTGKVCDLEVTANH